MTIEIGGASLMRQGPFGLALMPLDLHFIPAFDMIRSSTGVATMLTKDDVISTLRSAEPQLRASGVKRAALFGSMARFDTRSDSDIDIRVELNLDACLAVWEYVEIVGYIEDLFPMKVDVSNRKAMRDYVRPPAERDAIYAF